MSQSTLKPIFTCGYSGHTPAELKRAADALDALDAWVLDIRFVPRSRIPGWDAHELEALFGFRYQLLKAWGNVNYKTGAPIKLHDADLGFRKVSQLAEKHPIILLCGCADYQACHRRVVAELLRERGVTVEELAWPVDGAAGHVRTLSLWQPFASLIAVGAKTIETRHWSTTYRGPLVIHAAKTTKCMNLCDVEPFGSCLFTGPNAIEDLPLGALVCVADLVDCVPTETLKPTEPERSFGDYSAGRFGWILENIRALPAALPYRGGQGLFCVSIDLEAALRGDVATVHQEPLPRREKAPEHHCHAENCDVKVPPKMLMCAKHWRLVSKPLQREVWRHYRPGQEIDKKPTREYLDVMKRAIEAVADYEKQLAEPAQSTLF